MKVITNVPYVVNQPKYTNPKGDKFGGKGPAELGGAYLSLTYTPKAGDPTDIRWVQAINSSYRGGAYNPHLDNPDDRSVPYYDKGANDIAGKTWFADIPFAKEIEYEGIPVANVDFQVFLVQDKGPGGGFAHNVTLYGGIWWDYTYTASDTPEPTTFSLFAAGGLLIGLGRFRRRSRS